jgi:type II secretory pathway component PulF
MKWKPNINISQAYSPAYILVIILLTLLAVFLLYGIFDPYMVTIFPDMNIDNGGDAEWSTFAVNWWQLYFLIAFVISLIIFVIINAQRPEDQV